MYHENIHLQIPSRPSDAIGQRAAPAHDIWMFACICSRDCPALFRPSTSRCFPVFFISRAVSAARRASTCCFLPGHYLLRISLLPVRCRVKIGCYWGLACVCADGGATGRPDVWPATVRYLYSVLAGGVGGFCGPSRLAICQCFPNAPITCTSQGMARW